jgi:Zn-dependent M28 family amino/carboxypeptidase
MSRVRRWLAVAATAGVIGSGITAAPAAAELDEVDSTRLRRAVTVNGILQHARALQTIANANGATRASGTPGHAASVDYVAGRLEQAGYAVTRQSFAFPFFQELAPATLTVGPAALPVDTMDYSGSGTVTGAVVPARDNQIPPGPTASSSNAGCEPEDFLPASAAFPQIALVQRGTCEYIAKARNARQAGYDAVIVFNEGQPGRQELLMGTLGTPFDLPVVGVSFATGAALQAAAMAGEVSATVRTATFSEQRETTNVIARSALGDASQAVVAGAHLDSVLAGPGINDNGSGTATVLEIAEEMSELGVRPRRQVRFAFWAAEESGLLGSRHYVTTLPLDELGEVYANLNFDMVGSPNYVRFVRDGDGSETNTRTAPGSGEIERMFHRHFAARGLATAPAPFDGRSDYGPFIAVGIPAGGVFSGAEGIKTAAQAALHGGTAGVAYDPCYHRACDDVTNVNTQALAELGDAAAHGVLTLARSQGGLYGDDSRRALRPARARAATEPVAVR